MTSLEPHIRYRARCQLVIGRGRSGQYLVEFGLTFAFFIFVILAMINVLLAGYNYDLAQRAAWEAVRSAAIGHDNDTVAAILDAQFTRKSFGGMLMQTKIDYNPGNWLTPIDLMDRVEGTPITLNLDYSVGFSLGILPSFYVPFRVRSSMTCFAHNDEDRDNLNDDEEASPNNFLNRFPGATGTNGTAGGADANASDIDGDGMKDTADFGFIYYAPSTDEYYLRRHAGGGAFVITTPASLDGGYFAARIAELSSSGETLYSAPPLRPLPIPIDQSDDSPIVVPVDLRYDADNDGWEYKFDIDDANAAVAFGRNTPFWWSQ